MSLRRDRPQRPRGCLGSIYTARCIPRALHAPLHRTTTFTNARSRLPPNSCRIVDQDGYSCFPYARRCTLLPRLVHPARRGVLQARSRCRLLDQHPALDPRVDSRRDPRLVDHLPERGGYVDCTRLVCYFVTSLHPIPELFLLYSTLSDS